jgi:hypothetical protein
MSRKSTNELFSRTFATMFCISESLHPSATCLLISLKQHSRDSSHAEIQRRIESSSNPISIKGKQLLFNSGRVSPDTSGYIYEFSQRLANTELWWCFLLCKKTKRKKEETA